MHKIKVKICSTMELTMALKLYSNSWRIKVATTKTPKKKTQNGGVETHAHNYCET
jgi:hypothetical protein